MKQIIHKIIVKDGRSLVMPAWKGGQKGYGNLALPQIRDVDTIQKYPVGTKLLDSERVFYYAKAASSGNGITHTALAVKSKYPQAVGFAAITVGQVAGDKEITLTVGANDGVVGGTVEEDELAGGFILVFAGNNDEFISRIVSNTLGTSGNDMIVTLQDEIPTTVAIGEHAECMANPFLNVETNTDAHQPVVGVAHVQVTAGKWFWVQTWGPAWLAPGTDVLKDSGEFDVRFNSGNGALRDEGTSKAQRAGYGLPHAYGGSQGAPFFFLQLTP